ncbi:SPOR domain-containing protein [Desulfovibrio sp. OttesenSCG-928-C06]|nr:SPOR domain-containing protein [Desulfovibrio sp. OttesenSCG-928-C06]
MNMDNKQNTGGGGRCITIKMRMPVFVTALIVLIAGLIWIFILGVMVGRGYNTREHLGPLAVFVPGPPSAEATGELTATEDGANTPSGASQQDAGGASGSDAQASAGSTGELDALFKGDTLLRSEELDFKDNLQSPPDNAQGGSVAASTNASAPAAAQNVRPQPTQPAPVIQPAQPSQTQPAVPPAQSSDITVYEFIYQVASFNQLHQAQNLTQRLNAGGIPAQIELHKTSAATWYRVLVSFTGREAELAGFQQKLKQFSLNSPLLRKKKAVAG